MLESLASARVNDDDDDDETSDASSLVDVFLITTLAGVSFQSPFLSVSKAILLLFINSAASSLPTLGGKFRYYR